MRRDVYGQWTNVHAFVGDQDDGALGTAVSIHVGSSDDIVMVAGEPGVNRSRTWVFSNGGASWNSTIVPNTAGSSTGGYGSQIATNGMWMFVGEPALGGGAVHAYRRYASTATFELLQTITQTSHLGFPGEFGAAVAVSGDTVVIGAPNFRVVDGPQPSAFVYVRQGTAWVSQQWISWTYANGVYSEDFGRSVAIHGNRLVVGAPRTDALGRTESGRATSFVRSGAIWSQESIYHSSDPVGFGHFGASVALGDQALAVGALDTQEAFGRVDVWAPGSVFSAPVSWSSTTPAANDRFASSIALDRSFLLVGDEADNGRRGTVFCFDSRGTDCNGNSRTDILDVLESTSPDLDVDGIPDECQVDACQLRTFAPSTTSGSGLGFKVALSEHDALVGAYADDVGSQVDRGTARIASRNSASLGAVQTLLAPDGAAGDNFGHAVGLSGDLAVVGAPGDDDLGANAGCAWVFRRSSSTSIWEPLAVIHAPDGAAGDAFGAEIECSEDMLFVSATNRSVSGAASGAVYCFRRTGDAYAYETTLTSEQPGAGDAFGTALDFDVDQLVVGAPGTTVLGRSNAGAVHGFRRGAMGAWTFDFRRDLGVDALAGDRYGAAVAVRDTRVAVGAPDFAFLSANLGAVFVLERTAGGTSWSESFIEVSSATGDRLGASLAFAADDLLIGAPGASSAVASGSGVVHVARELSGVWDLVGHLTSTTLGYDLRFGTSIAWSSGELLVGAPGADVAVTNSGAAYTLGFGGVDCNANGSCDLCEIDTGSLGDANGDGLADDCQLYTYCFGDGSGTPCPCGNHSAVGQDAGCRSSIGTGGTLRVAGTPSLLHDSLVVSCANLPNSAGLVYQGTNQANGGLGTAWGDGLRCAGGTITRIATVAIVGGAASYPAPGQTPISARGLVTAPGWRYYSVWYRNPATFCTSAPFNYTNGVAVLWSN